ncbi:GUN4 domain-containing protein [Streptomyces polygonati]|uniref:GUN4 domain-containing protein n=1 Tax=Streptomyces polygonati TaxID=1617087 RepID=A0ABV8HM58_9ACTN
MGSSRDVVLAVGVNRLPGIPRMPVLAYAEADAAALARTFRTLGLAADRVHTLTGPEATFENIGRHIAEIPRHFPDLTSRDRVWFSFSGHGVTGMDGRTHLLVHDTAVDRWRGPERSVTVEQVVNVLPDASAADRILLLDACRENAGPQARSGLPGPAAGLDGIDLRRHPGVAIFSGCGEGGVSFEDPRRKLGVFTAAVIDILGGAERPLSAEELEARLLEAVPRASRELGPAYYQQPSLRSEPYWQAAAMLLFPHLLTGADLGTLRRKAEAALPATAAALWEALHLLDPEDTAARRLHEHFGALADAAAGSQPGRGQSALPLDRLDDLLRVREWQRADRETIRLLMIAAGSDPERLGNRMIPMDRVPHLRREDLAALDELWMRRSDGRFGFTPQLQRLYTAEGDIARFADLIGWRNGRWFLYPEAQWRSGAPGGHLPILGPIGGIRPAWKMSYARQGLAALGTAQQGMRYAVRDYRDPGVVERATADIAVDDSFDWSRYNRLAAITMGHVYSSAARGKLSPLAAVYKEGAVRRFGVSYTSLLSAVWAVNRVPLLRHYASLVPGASSTGTAGGTAPGAAD